jgi:hypothetical protein
VHYFALIILCLLAVLTIGRAITPRAKLAVGIGVGLAFGIVLVSTVVRLAAGSDFPHVFKFYLQRYFYVSKLILMTFLLAELVSRFRLLFPSLTLPAKGALAFACALYFLAVNKANNRLYANAHDEGVRISQFLKSVQENSRLAKAGLPYVSEWTLPRQAGWDIHLSVDQHLGKAAPAARDAVQR